MNGFDESLIILTIVSGSPSQTKGSTRVDSEWWFFLGGAALLCVGAIFRLRSLRPSWGWNDVMIQLVVGRRLTEVYVSEVRRVGLEDGWLFFDIQAGRQRIATKWVVAPFVGALAVACAVPEAELQQRLNAEVSSELWAGAPGTFRLPKFAID